MEFIVFVAFVILVFSHISLAKRVSQLEYRQRRKMMSPDPSGESLSEEARPLHADDAEVHDYSEPKPSFVSEMTPIKPIPPAQFQPKEPSGEFFLYTWFREQTLIKIGSIIFFLGAVWFVSYAIESGWISPLMRILLGLLLACAIYATGFLRKAAEPVQYQVLTTMGTGVFLGTVIASQFAFVVPVLPAAAAFSLMVASICYTLFVALQTKTEWLAIAASVAGLCIPLLVKFEEPLPFLLLTYIFLLSAGFLVVVFFTSWRSVSLTLLVGSAFHLALISNSSLMSDNALWFFVVIFSALFCASTTVSVARTNDPTIYDVSTLTIISLQFIGYAVAIAIIPELALFVAAAFTATIGYLLRIRGAHANAVSLFVAVSIIFSLVGTTLLFDGFALTIAYAVEVLAIYLLSLNIATLQRSIYVAAALFLLPFASGFMDLSGPAWRDGIIHSEALGTLFVLLTFGFAVVWTLRNSALQAINWLRETAGALLIGWYLFAVAASLATANALRLSLDKSFTETILLAVTSGLVIMYVVYAVKRDTWRIGALLTLIVPTISALVLFGNPAWQNSISHQPFVAALIFFLGLVGITIVYFLHSDRDPRSLVMKTCAYILLWVVLGYGLIFLTNIWDALLSGTENRVVTSISFTVLIYLIISSLMVARVVVGKIVPFIVTLIIPVFLLLESLNFSGWKDGVLSVDALGLYVTTTILALLATSLLQHSELVPDEDKKAFRVSAFTLYGVAGVLAFMLVWMLSQTIFASEAIAVTVALFIYTVVGLMTYSYGRIVASKTWRRTGVLLLSAVILRLALVDVWAMEPVWRIVTFLGIGLLFIVTALLERSRDKRKMEAEVTE